MRTVKLGDICEFKPKKSEAKVRLKDGDLVSFASMDMLPVNQKYFSSEDERPLESVYSNYTYFQENDVIYAKITPCFENGKLSIAKNLKNGVGFGSSEFVPIRCSDQIIPEYLYYFLLNPSFIRSGIPEMTGASGHRRVPNSYTENLDIPLPSLEEQRRIVARLDAAFEKIDRAIEFTEKNLRSAQEFPSTWVEDHFHSKKKNWEQVKLSDIADFKGGGTPSKAIPAYWSGDIPWVSPKDMKSIRINDSQDHISKVAIENSSTSMIPAGATLLVVRSGILAHTIPLAVNTVSVTLNQDMKAIIPRDGIDSNFLFSVLHANRKRISTFVSKGATVHRINSDQLKNLSLSYTLHLEEQKNFAVACETIIAQSQELQELYQKKLTYLKVLRQSLLQQAFSTTDNV